MASGEDSVFIAALQKRLNDSISRGEQPDILDIENDILEDGSIIQSPWREDVKKEVERVALERRRAHRSAQQKTLRRYGGAIDLFDNCLAYSDYVNSQLIEVIFGKGARVLSAKDFDEHSVRLTGAYLKCILMISLQGRSCMLGTEISYLLRNGFSDGAASRLRSLHEHVVTLILLMNDHTYEIADRYQDHAAYEDLKRLRALRINLSQPIWSSSPEAEAYVDNEIAEVEELVREGRDRWGSQITEQYGWSRPAFSAEKKRITFQDLERVTGLDMLRSDYLRENNSVHAGPFATINHFDPNDARQESTRPHVNADKMIFAGSRASMMIGWATRAAARAVSFETEEYDKFLLYIPLKPMVDAATDSFFQHLRS